MKMKSKGVSMVLISVLLSLAVLEIQPIAMVGAEGTTEFDIFNFVNAVGNYFEVTRSPYLNVTLASTEIVHLTLESIPGLVSFLIESNSSATSTVLTLGGFEASTTYYLYQDGVFIESFTTDSSGRYTFTQDISQGHHVFIQQRPSTIHIKSDGSVDPSTAPISVVGSLYTFTADIYETIQVNKSNIVIDGNGYMLQGSGSGYGFYLLGGISGVTITNTVVKGWSVGVMVEVPYPQELVVGNNTIGSNTIVDNYRGIQFWYSGYNEVSGNIISNNNEAGILFGNSPYNMISGNLISRNTEPDTGSIVILWLSEYNTIKENLIVSNYGGIALHSQNNLIYHNDIIDNTIQTSPDNPNNLWYEPLLLEGNHWSDYTGEDTSGDGLIGDTLTPWPTTGYDLYPFVTPLWSPISATIDIEPNTLNLKSNGQSVTVHIELPVGSQAVSTAVDLSTVWLDGIAAIGWVNSATVSFDRATVRDALTGMIDLDEGTKFFELTLTLTGVVAGISFEGTDTITVIK